MNYQKEKQFAIQVAKKAGLALLKNFKQYQFRRMALRQKSTHEILTQADLLANKIILSAIKEKFPSHGILSEETGFYQKKSSYLWAVDPLDGTTNFFLGLPLWGVNLALFHQGELVLGVVFLPCFNELYWAVKKQGAFLNNKKIGVSRVSKLSQSLATYCYAYQSKVIRQAHQLGLFLREKTIDARQLGSAAFEATWLARGKSDIFLSLSVNVWDVAAGEIIIQEAGGQVTDLKGKKRNLNSRSFVATNGRLHSELLKLLIKHKIDKV